MSRVSKRAASQGAVLVEARTRDRDKEKCVERGTHPERGTVYLAEISHPVLGTGVKVGRTEPGRGKHVEIEKAIKREFRAQGWIDQRAESGWTEIAWQKKGFTDKDLLHIYRVHLRNRKDVKVTRPLGAVELLHWAESRPTEQNKPQFLVGPSWLGKSHWVGTHLIGAEGPHYATWGDDYELFPYLGTKRNMRIYTRRGVQVVTSIDRGDWRSVDMLNVLRSRLSLGPVVMEGARLWSKVREVALPLRPRVATLDVSLKNYVRNARARNRDESEHVLGRRLERWRRKWETKIVPEVRSAGGVAELITDV